MADKEGHTGRKAWQGFVDRGPSFSRYEEALAELDGPPAPSCLEYLLGWIAALHGRSGVGPSSINPLTYETIESWARLMDVCPQPHEVETLLILDGIMCHPKPLDEDKDEE